jgi:outer membrane receptor for ferrienterochelin and colicin
MSSNRSFYLKVPLFLVLFLANIINAQTTGKITGVVRDAQTGEALPGANVLVQGTTLGAATDTEGLFMILRVPPGKHTVIVEYIGYRRILMSEVEVLTDLTTDLNFNLEPEAFAGDEVIVRAKRPLVRRDLTSVETRVQAEQIQAMAVQEVSQLLDLQAGIIRDEDGDIHIRGGRTSEVAYLVNGISVTDDYSRQQALTVENGSIQELQVISGTFNAEYGNAMSGVINIVTKTGGNDFSAKIETWLGDYISSRTDLFWNIDDINPLANYNFEGAISGPILKNRLTYFLAARRVSSAGWLYGPDAYSPQGRSQVIDGVTTEVRGDSAAVAMNPSERWSGLATLQYRISNPFTLRLDILGSTYKGNNYDHSYRLNPKGNYTNFASGVITITKLTHVLNKNNFYELIASYKVNENISRLYKDPYDARYVHPDSLAAGQYNFYKAGTNLFRSKRTTESLNAKLDFTSQITNHHQLKTGVEFNADQVSFNDLTLIPATDESGQQITPFQPAIPAVSSASHNEFTRKPKKIALYIQDKIELESVVINLGLRFDYFHSHGKIPQDPQDPNIYLPFKLNHIYKDSDGNGSISLDEQTEENKYTLPERDAFWYQQVKAKSLLSPRFGIAYPITERGVIHFSYGIFQQIPEYSLLYYNDEIKTPEGQGIYGPNGNPDLNPQRTTMYEIGLSQQLMENFGIDVTAYYRDIRDWISTSPQIPTYSAGVSYVTNINRDQANVKGISFTMTRQMYNHFGFDLNYTYQIVKGTNSSPEDEYFALTTGVEPKKKLSLLNWDQRHSFNFSFIFNGKTWGGNLISRLQTGQPYTPEVVSGVRTGQNVLPDLATNSRNKPTRLTIDFTTFKKINIARYNLEFFIVVYNLLDFGNPDQVFADSGKPDYSVYDQPTTDADPGWFIRPDYYAEPRRIQIGTRISF